MSSIDIVPEAYRGAWQQQVQPANTGTAPRSFWLQTKRLHASIFIPDNRPDFSGKAALSDFNKDELLWLASQRGIAGSCFVEGNMLHRRRQIDYQSSRGKVNERYMSFDNDYLLETLPNSTEHLLWRKISESGAESIALRFQDETGVTDISGQRKGLLLVVGDYFMYVRDRGYFVPQSESLGTLSECREYSRQQLAELLDFEISFGLRRAGNMPWEIRHSTLPFREGKALMGEGGIESLAKNGGGMQKVNRNGKSVLRRWSVDDWSHAASELNRD